MVLSFVQELTPCRSILSAAQIGRSVRVMDDPSCSIDVLTRFEKRRNTIASTPTTTSHDEWPNVNSGRAYPATLQQLQLPVFTGLASMGTPRSRAPPSRTPDVRWLSMIPVHQFLGTRHHMHYTRHEVWTAWLLALLLQGSFPSHDSGPYQPPPLWPFV